MLSPNSRFKIYPPLEGAGGGSRIQDSRFKIQDSRFKIQGSRIQKLKKR